MLLTMLAVAVALFMFPVLDSPALLESESRILQALSDGGPGPLSGIFTGQDDLLTACYTRIVALLYGLFPTLSPAFLVRLPGAVAVFAMTLSLFSFGGVYEGLGAAFFSSLLFLSCAIVLTSAFFATPCIIPAALLVLAMMSLYHWLSKPSRRYFWLLVGTSALAMTIIGATALVAMVLMSTVFIVSSRGEWWRRYLVMLLALALSAGVAYLAVYTLTGNADVAMVVFKMSHQLDEGTVLGINNMAAVLLAFTLVGLFPWSLPLVASIPWIARNPKWLVARFRGLELLRRYGIIVFLFSLPSMLFNTQLAYILIITAIFFNMPLIGRFLMAQMSHHPAVWRLMGAICTAAVGLLTVAFAMGLSGVDLGIEKLATSGSWTLWSGALTFLIFSSIYWMWRNVRSMGVNNRFMYSLIMLYLFFIALLVGYVL